MTFGELFREVAHEVGMPECESSERYADTVAPTLINREVPAEHFDEIKAEFVKSAKRIMALPIEECGRLAREHIAKN